MDTQDKKAWLEMNGEIRIFHHDNDDSFTLLWSLDTGDSYYDGFSEDAIVNGLFDEVYESLLSCCVDDQDIVA